jgi:hypothetical protein
MFSWVVGFNAGTHSSGSTTRLAWLGQGSGHALRESLFGREDSYFLHHRLYGYAHTVWEGARWLGVWDAQPGSAQRSIMGVGAVRRIRTAPTHSQ